METRRVNVAIPIDTSDVARREFKNPANQNSNRDDFIDQDAASNQVPQTEETEWEFKETPVPTDSIPEPLPEVTRPIIVEPGIPTESTSDFAIDDAESIAIESSPMSEGPVKNQSDIDIEDANFDEENTNTPPEVNEPPLSFGNIKEKGRLTTAEIFPLDVILTSKFGTFNSNATVQDVTPPPPAKPEPSITDDETLKPSPLPKKGER